MTTIASRARALTWIVLFVGASVYLFGTGGLAHDFSIFGINFVPGTVESLSQARARPHGEVGAARTIILGPNLSCASIATSPHGRLVAVAENDPGAVVLISRRSGRLMSRFPMGCTSCVAFSPLGNCLAVAGSRNLLLPLRRDHFGKAIAIDAKTWKLQASGQKDTKTYLTEERDVCFFHGGRRVALASGDRLGLYVVPKWLLAHGRPAGQAPPPGPLRELGSTDAYTPSSLRAARGGHFFLIESGDVVRIDTNPLRNAWQQFIPAEVSALAVSPDAGRVICVGTNSRLGPESWIFNPLGSAIAAGGHGREWFLNIGSGTITRTRRSSTDFVAAVADQRGNEIALGLSWDSRIGGSSVVLINPRSGRRNATLTIPLGDRVTRAMCLTVDGRYVIAAYGHSQADSGAEVAKLLVWKVR